jgi:hypothetical protein
VASPGETLSVKATPLRAPDNHEQVADSDAGIHVADGHAAASDPVTLENLPHGWTCERESNRDKRSAESPASATFVLRTAAACEGDIESLELRVGGADPPRRVTAQVLIASAALVREAEQADETDGEIAVLPAAELSGQAGLQFRGNGQLTFALQQPISGNYALWLRARWTPDSSTSMTLAWDGRKPRQLRATAMIGFTDWEDPARAHTKMFAHFGEQYGHWSWYRIPDVALTSATRQLTLTAEAGACFDALLLLPQLPAVDRAAMNLFQNWNYSPWLNPL